MDDCFRISLLLSLIIHSLYIFHYNVVVFPDDSMWANPVWGLGVQEEDQKFRDGFRELGILDSDLEKGVKTGLSQE